MSEHLIKAEQLIEHSKYDMALKELDTHLAADPNDGYAYYLKALAYMHKNKEREALENAEKSVGLVPDQAYPHYILALIKLNLSQRAREAEKHIREAMRIDPHEAHYYYVMAQLKINRSEYKEALKYADEGLAVDPENTECKNVRAVALGKLKRGDEAAEILEETLQEAPEDYMTLTNKGWQLLEAGDHKQALEVFKEALRINPNYEYAKSGLINSLKAHNPLFKLFLTYYFWMDRLGTKGQWAVIIGLVVLMRIVRSTVDTNPELEPILNPILYIYLAFVVLTWSIDPIFNLFLRFNKYGKYALDKGEVIAANLVAGFIGAAGVAAGVSYLTDGAFSWFAAALLFLMIIPISGTYNFYEERSFRKLQIFTGVLLLLLVVGVLTSILGISGSFAFYALCFLGIIGFTWIANFVRTRD